MVTSGLYMCACPPDSTQFEQRRAHIIMETATAAYTEAPDSLGERGWGGG